MMSSAESSATGGLKKIMTRLKDDTKAYHTKLERLPYFNALIEHTLPIECYVNQLRGLSVIHGVLENEIAAAEDSRVSDVWNDGLRKLAFLEEDLSFFKPRFISDAREPIETALSMTEKIRLRQIENSVTLLGYLYVLEGSTLGNNMHRPDISATFHLVGMNGCRYYSSYQDQVQTHWMQFSEKMNTVLNDPAVHDVVAEAAHEAFAGLEALYTALYPLKKSEKKYHVTRINPEAGNHPIPTDEREIQAALKASNRGWAEFGYYEQRYGKRGKKFSDSDTCWLATLTALDPETLQKQIDWLCRILATRGMPSIMMERTLTVLHEELSRAIPDKMSLYEKLEVSADTLRRSRENVFSDKAFRSLAEEFETDIEPEMAAKFRSTGQLLVAAVADEKNGIEGSVAALKEWLTDGNRFSTKWIRAVKKTLAKADNQASG
ncbi:MAG: biliverdin-producing heme oxygenase [Deltaproteobacteria bacterium]|nr:biliverdin-producing heme oxygenase [Deltaproteobacteria bacterium]